MSNYQHKRSLVAGKIPLAGDLLDGEIAVNIKDRKLFAKDDQGVVFEFLGGNSAGVETVNGVSPVSGNVTLNALNISPTADRLWLTQAERQLIAGFDAYDKAESDDRYLLETNNLSDLTNASTARTNLGLGNLATVSLSGNPYHTGNILGTVSQSGGIPAGAIIENGSNINGKYTKFADGTLMTISEIDVVGGTTEVTGSLFRSGVNICNLPSVFITPPSFYGRPSEGLLRWVSKSGSLSNTRADFVLVSTANNATSDSTSIVAIGRWF